MIGDDLDNGKGQEVECYDEVSITQDDQTHSYIMLAIGVPISLSFLTLRADGYHLSLCVLGLHLWNFYIL